MMIAASAVTARSGPRVTARAEVMEINQTRARVTLRTVCTVGGEVMVDGEAVVMAPRRSV